MTQDNATVLYAVEDGVARLTLNRPEKRNALNDELIAGLKKALRRADHDEAVRAAVLLGSGSDFCSGADLKALQKISKASVAENLEDARSMMELFLLIREVRVPVTAAVQGRALAGGFGLALACDMVLASHSARFGFPEVKIGFVPAMVLAILRRNVSEKKAFELITTGDEITAEEGERLGLINRVFGDDKFATDVQRFVKRFEKISTSAMGLSKRLLYQIDGQTLGDSMCAGVDINAVARMTEDCREGIERFLKKQ
jgi:methylglutaconyl-CoA hydratase